MGFALNEVVGNYECLGIIRKPRSGLTYKVRNLATGEVEALRALPGASTADAESAERLAREIRIHTRLTHPNVVGFHDAFELDGQLVMTTDYVEGSTLAELAREVPLPVAEAVRIVVAVLEGLEDAHALGIVHRGITADQILVAADGAVKLGGFDLAKPANDTNLTKVGAVIGDPRYVSPEQILGRTDLDGRADLYSAGIALYLALTGKLPFEGASDIDILSAHVGVEPQAPSALNPAVWAPVEAVVLQALRKKPEERFASAREFREALARAESKVDEPRPAVQVQPAPVAGPPPRRSFRAPIAVASLCAVAAAIAWIVLR